LTELKKEQKVIKRELYKEEIDKAIEELFNEE
jgi:hypothetical protein